MFGKYSLSSLHSISDIIFSFGILCLLVLTPVACLNGDLDIVLAHWHSERGTEFIARLVLNSATCFAHTYLTLLTVIIAGSDGVNIAGILKDVGLTYVGFVCFQDATVSGAMLSGLTLSFLAAIAYATFKLQDKYSVDKKIVKKD